LGGDRTKEVTALWTALDGIGTYGGAFGEVTVSAPGRPERPRLLMEA
jgi:hypothetical protein